jgi:putative PIN family toxin of toxin-antitoxin system
MKPAFSKPRLVLDTNVLLSALLFRTGTLAWLREAWQTETIRPLASRDTISELIRVLAYPKFALGDEDREQLLGDYLPWCETLAEPDVHPLPECRDPFDRMFLALALAAKADAIITGEKDLLALALDFPLPIVTPAALRDRLATPKNE